MLREIRSSVRGSDSCAGFAARQLPLQAQQVPGAVRCDMTVVPRTASLPMYDFPELRAHTDALWAAIRVALRASGVDAPDDLSRELLPLREHWLDPSLILSHTCGHPAVTVLDGKVDILGSWATMVDEPGRPGWYRSVIVARADDTRADDLRSFARSGLRLCANGPDSLSGWVSLASFLHAEPGLDDDLLINEVPVLVTGSHAASLLALQNGTADLASIDAWTFTLLSRVRSDCVRGLRVIGRGPEVAVTPLFTSRRGPVDILREVLVGVAAAPTLAVSRAALGIRGFVPHGMEAHDDVRDLAQRCEPTIGLLRRIVL